MPLAALLLRAARVAGCIAKYATKSNGDAGGLAHRIDKAHELRHLGCRDHARRLITGAWQLGERGEIDGKRIRRWAHQFGFGGHCFTKTRRFSTTFKALRAAQPVRDVQLGGVQRRVRREWTKLGLEPIGLHESRRRHGSITPACRRRSPPR